MPEKIKKGNASHAREIKRCPKCGTILNYTTTSLFCPNCLHEFNSKLQTAEDIYLERQRKCELCGENPSGARFLIGQGYNGVFCCEQCKDQWIAALLAHYHLKGTKKNIKLIASQFIEQKKYNPRARPVRNV